MMSDALEVEEPAAFVDDLEQRFMAQKELINCGGALSLQEREQVLDACVEMLSDKRDQFVEAIASDFGARPRGLTLMYDLLGSISSIKYARKHMRDWVRADKRKVSFPYNFSGARARVEYQAKGVVGILGTWNVPLFTLLSPLAQVIAAGNRALIKPSDLAPNTGELLAETMPDYIDPESIAAVHGGRTLAERFSQLPFDHLVFTGGTEVGRAVMSAAAKNLTPVTLELGGKSPVIIGRSASIEDAADKIISFKATNAGQLCVCPDYALVPEERVNAFIASCKKAYSDTYERTPQEAGNIINARHYQRLQSYLDDASARGSEIIQLAPEGDYGSQCMPVTLVLNPAEDSLLRQHEIFGPILIVDSYEHIDQALADIGARDHPLALYYFGTDKSEQRQVLDRSRSGGVTINHVAQHASVEDAPFGGIGASGIGRYHGREGFLEFSHARTVYTQGLFDVNSLMGAVPPFGQKLQKRLDSVFK